MRATVLVDNIANDNLSGEWGLSLVIEYRGKQILLDAGASNLYLKNAKKLGITISDVEYAVLSHGHYDHANGMESFFKENEKAKFYLRSGTGENCYAKAFVFRKYIGIPKHILSTYGDRIIMADGDCRLMEGVTLNPHKTAGLAEIGKQNKMYIRKNHRWLPDDFSHEQSLVFDTQEGLVIFNSCSHGGADNIINEISVIYPNKKIRALIGGFHIFNKSEDEVRALAERLHETGVEEIYTGHCTGKKAFQILKEELGDRVKQLKVGMVMEF